MSGREREGGYADLSRPPTQICERTRGPFLTNDHAIMRGCGYNYALAQQFNSLQFNEFKGAA
jgi:hypothetical protein